MTPGKSAKQTSTETLTDALDLIQAGMYGIGGRCAIRRNELFSLQLSNEATVGFGLVLFFCSTGNG